MPLPLATIIPAAASLVGQGLNAISQARANKQQLKYNQQMYQQQRKDSLADWEMQNKYNSPQQQMQRLSEAGLNPAMIYGKGTVDNFGGSVRSADAKNYSPIAPKLDLSAIPASISQYADLQLKKAQTDNLRNAIETSKEQRALLAAQALKTAKDTDYTTFKMMRDNLLLQTSVDAATESVRETRARTTSITDSNNRANEVQRVMLQPNLNKTLAEIANIQANTGKNQFERDVLKAQAEQIKKNTSWIDLNNTQQQELNNYLKDERRLNNLFNANSIEGKLEALKLDNFLKKMEVPRDIKNDLLKVLIPWYNETLITNQKLKK